jgi:hypothetical protein
MPRSSCRRAWAARQGRRCQRWGRAGRRRGPAAPLWWARTTPRHAHPSPLGDPFRTLVVLLWTPAGLEAVAVAVAVAVAGLEVVAVAVAVAE